MFPSSPKFPERGRRYPQEESDTMGVRAFVSRSKIPEERLSSNVPEQVSRVNHIRNQAYL